MTNFEQIKGMNVEEMAEFMSVYGICDFCTCYPEPRPCSMPCNKGVKKWLESEAEDNGTV